MYEESEPQKQVQQKLSLDKICNEIELKKLRASTLSQFLSHKGKSHYRPQNWDYRNNHRLNKSQHINKYQGHNNRYNAKIHNNHKYGNIKHIDIRNNIEELHLYHFLERNQNYMDMGWPTTTKN